MFLKSGKFDMLDLVRSRTFNNNKPFYSKKSGIFKSLHNFVAKNLPENYKPANDVIFNSNRFEVCDIL